MGLFAQIRLSYQMTVAAGRMTMRYPQSILVAVGSMGVLVLAAVIPLGIMIHLAVADFDAFLFALRYVFQFWAVEAAFEAGGFEAGVPAFMLWLLGIYVVWMTIVAFVGLVTSTVIMHTGVQQLRGQPPRLREGFALAGRNWARLLGLALLAGAGMGLLKRFTVPLRAVPFVGRFLRGALIALLTGVLYLSLPVVVYERQGPYAALRSTWRDVRKTWGGLVVGTGLVMSAMWAGLWVVGIVATTFLEATFGIETSWSALLVLQLLAAVALYAVNIALSANLRAALYLHVREGHAGVIPEGALAMRNVPVQAPRQTTFEVVQRP